MTLQLKFVPYLIQDRHDAVPYDSNLKIDEANEMAKKLITQYIGKIYEYKPFKSQYDLIEVTCGKGKYIKGMDEDDIRQYLDCLFGNYYDWIGDEAVSTWLAGDTEIFDDMTHGILEFGIAFNTLKIVDSKGVETKKSRPSPSESAKSYPLGSVMEGNDGCDWINKEVKGGSVRWIRV
jgi:hypothetical protein